MVYVSEGLSLEIHISTEQYECSSLLGSLGITEVDIVPEPIKLIAVINVLTITDLVSIHADEMVVPTAQEGTQYSISYVGIISIGFLVGESGNLGPFGFMEHSLRRLHHELSP